MWVEPAGHAAVGAELVRDLYAAAAERWVADGLTLHYAMLPASDDALVDAWFRLGFGHQQVYAIRETPSAEERPAGPPGLIVRLARREDLDALARLDVALPAHQALSPVFSRRSLPTVEDARAEYETDFDDPRFTTFVVERDDEVIGSAIACAIEMSSDHKSLALPPGAGFLGFASVLPGGAGLRRGPPARRGGARLGARDRARMGRHRLAHDEPAVVARLAPPRVPADASTASTARSPDGAGSTGARGPAA